MFNKIIGLAVAIIAIFLWQFSATADANTKVKMHTSQLVEHPALDATTSGMMQGLSDAGYSKENADIVVESAQGSVSLANQISNKFVSKNPDAVVGVATVSAQSISKHADHRVIDGKDAVTFLVKVKEAIEDPERLLLDL